MDWKAGKITSLKIHANADGKFKLIPPTGQGIASIHATGPNSAPTKSDVIPLKSGVTYEITLQ
jgi:hypothetical protein